LALYLLKSLFINQIWKVPPPQLLADSPSTPLLGNASILSMDRFPSQDSTRQGASDFRASQSPSRTKSVKEARAAGIGERGAGHLKAIVWTLILASLVYVAFKVTPPLINEYEFQDGLQTIARFASVNRDSNEKVRDAILKEAKKDDVPVQADDIKIVGNAGNVVINANYSVTVDLSVYQWTLNFHPKVTNDALF
jgi:hypothetical protein